MTNNNFTVNFSKHVNEDANGKTYYLVDSICNQEQETTSFDYTIAKRKFSIGNNTLSEQVYNYTNLLTKIKYPTGIETRYAYQKVLTNNLFDKDYNDEKSVVQSKVIVDGETEYAQTNYTYYSRDESTEEQSDLWEKCYGRYVKVSENNGVFKEIKFSLDRRSKETIYNADGSVYEIYETEFQGPNVVSQIKKKGKNITNLIDASYLVADMPASTKLQKDAPSTSASITRQYKFVYEYSKQEWSWNTRKPLYALQKKSIWYDDCHQLLTHNTLDKKNKLVTQTEVKMYDSTTETSTTLSRVDYEYDECGNMTKKREYPDITNSNDYIETQITYQDNTLPISISVTGVKDADGNLVNGTGIITETYVYDDLGRMIASTDGSGNTRQYTYDKVGRLTSVSFPDGTAQTYVFDTPLSKTTYTDRNGNTYIYQYTNIGLLDTITDPNETILCDNDYDNRGRLIRSTNAENASSYSELTYTYDDHDRVVKKTVFGQNNEYLTSENYQYDTDTNSVTTFYGEQTQVGYRKEYNKYDELIGEYTISGEEHYDEKSYTYDRFGRLTNETGYGINNTYVYDALDNLVGTTDILNNQTSLSYDSLNRLLSSTDAEDNTTTYRYDSLGRTIETRTPVETAINGSLVYSVQKQYYDNNSNLTRQAVSTNENGGFRETLYTYDVMNRLVSTQTGNIVSTYTYTNADKIATQTVGESTTTYLYDILGHLSAVTDALGQTEHYTYDANNLLVSKIDRNGSTFTYTYDALGRIVSQAVAGYDGTTSNRTYLYDAFGNLLSQQEDEITISYTYDTINRLLSRYEGSTVETEGQPERIYQTFSYIPNTSVIQSYQLMQGTTPRVNVTYTYDDAGRLTRVDENGSFAASYTYNARGLNTKVTYGNGISTSKTYTQGGQLRNLTVAQTNKGVLYSETNKYGSDGNLTKKSHGLKYKPTYTDTYTYDASGMLATEKRMEETTPIYSYVYTYDTRGNRVGLTDNVNGETSGYTYDLNNRLLTLDKTVADIRPYSSLTSYYYDPNGNTVSSVTETLNEWHGSDDSDYGITEDFGSVMDGYAFTLNEYDVYNRLTHVKNSEHDARYTYNPDNLRRTKTVDGNTETFLWNPSSEIVATIVDNSVQNTYVYGLDRILGIDALGTKTYYQQNGHHDTLLVSDKNGNTVSSYVYDAFGTQLNSNANDTNPFRYTGEYFDAETGFIYLRARYMNPETGRFISEDPVSDGVNWYAYAAGNPVRYSDPSGLFIVLTGIEDESDERFVALQQLTDDTLKVDFLSGHVSIGTQMSDEHVLRPTGTGLLREIIASNQGVEIIFTKGGSITEMIQVTDDCGNISYTDIVIYYDPNQSGFTPTARGVSKTPGYIIMGHELIHAYRGLNRTFVPQGAGFVYPLWEDEIYVGNKKKGDDIEELETTGLPYTTFTETTKIDKDTLSVSKFNPCQNAFTGNTYTENALRAENLLPLRFRY